MVDPHPPLPHRVEDTRVGPLRDPGVQAGELPRPEVAATLRHAGVDGVRALAEHGPPVELARQALVGLALRIRAGHPGVLHGEVVVGVRRDPERPALGEQGVPESADRGRGPVEPAVGAVRVGGIAGPAVGARGVDVLAALIARSGVLAEGRALGSGSPLHADHDVGVGIAPRAQLVRGVDAEAQRMVGEHHRVVDDPGALLGPEPRDRLRRAALELGGLRRVRRTLPAVELAVPRQFESPQRPCVLGAGGDEHPSHARHRGCTTRGPGRSAGLRESRSLCSCSRAAGSPRSAWAKLLCSVNASQSTP